jgi:adenylate cyclase
MEERNFNSPTRHLRQVAWRVSTYGHLGRTCEAKQSARLFIERAPSLWRGDPAAGPSEYVDWVVDVSHLRRDEDAERLREGLRRAGLPA